MLNNATGLSHGKIILMGEHSVVYNQPAIAIPLTNIQMKAYISKYHKLYIDCDFYTGLLSSMPELFNSLKTLIYYILDEYNLSNETFKLQLESDIPIERGMGSSAAVAVATVKALNNYFSLNLSQEEILKFVNISETIAHGKPSGLDALLTSNYTPYYFIKNQTPIPIETNLEAILIVADSGITGQTKLAVQNVQKLINENTQTIKIIQQLGELTSDAKDTMINNQPSKLGQLMTLAHKNLQKLNVSNNKIDQLVDVSLGNGALGAKMTGGGLGGCMIALAYKNNTQKINQALKDCGVKNIWNIDLKGLKND